MKNPLQKQQIFGLGILLMMIGALYCVLHIAQSSNDSSLSDETTARLEIASAEKQMDDNYPIQLHYFDPNTADSTSLQQLGLLPWQVRSILKYRAKGGVYRQVEDLLRIPWMNDSLYSVLSPYVRIAPLPQDLRRDSLRRAWAHRDSLWHDSIRVDSLRRDSVYKSKNYHLKRDTLLELNQADTNALQFIKGIGPVTALRIVRYRKQLGGYCSLHQLREIPGMESVKWDSIVPHLWVNPDSVRPIPVNRASIERLQRHPYISFTTAKSIYTLRRNRVRLRGMDDLQGVLDADNLQRLRPYLDFSE